MFKLLFTSLTLFFAMASFSARAQMADRLTEHPNMSRFASAHKSPSDDPVAVTREMTTRLHLNEGQFLKLLPLNRTKIAGMKSINREYKNDEAARTSKAAELEAQYEQECSRILTPSQLSQLQQENQPATAPAGTGTGLG